MGQGQVATGCSPSRLASNLASGLAENPTLEGSQLRTWSSGAGEHSHGDQSHNQRQVLLKINTQKRGALEEEISKVFDYTSDQHYGKLF